MHADNCTAAITQEGSLYMWGVGSAGNLGYRNTLRQFLPRQVIGSLADVVVTKVRTPAHIMRLFSI